MRIATPRHHAAQRLAVLFALDDAAIAALGAGIGRAHILPPRSEILVEGGRIAEPQLLVEGWAARVRTLQDGRRQLLSFVLPGDLVGYCHQDRPLASSTVIAITPVKLCPAPDPDEHPSLRRAYAVSGALEEAHLLAQIARLGRLSALERLCDVLLELNERLELIGLARGGTFDCPLTQEMLADVLGLTPVHVNRMLQQARSLGDVEWRGRRVRIVNPAGLAAKVGREPVRVQG